MEKWTPEILHTKRVSRNLKTRIGKANPPYPIAGTGRPRDHQKSKKRKTQKFKNLQNLGNLRVV